MKEKIGIHCFVVGRVQGVFFRATTCEVAQSLGLTGWVRNLEDGRVEVKAYGDKEKVEQLQLWLRHGPERAQVGEMTCNEIPWVEVIDFKRI